MPLKTAKTRRLRRSPLTGTSHYRLPKAVCTVLQLPSGNCYPLCPQCGSSLDREYLRFCSCCGQHLCWQYLSAARVRYSARKRTQTF